MCPPRRADHVGQHELRGADEAADVDVHGRPPVVGLDLPERSDGAGHTGVVHEEVDRTESCSEALDRNGEVVAIGHVGGRGRRRAAAGLDQPPPTPRARPPNGRAGPLRHRRRRSGAATWRPMPRPPPVTRATDPVSGLAAGVGVEHGVGGSASVCMGLTLRLRPPPGHEHRLLKPRGCVGPVEHRLLRRSGIVGCSDDRMTPGQIELVESTVATLDLEPLAADFYERAFALDPAVPEMFTNRRIGPARPLRGRARRFRPTRSGRIDTFAPAAMALGARHRGYGVKASHYRLMGQALMASLAAALGPRWTPEVDEAWSLAYNLIVETMMTGAMEDPLPG